MHNKILLSCWLVFWAASLQAETLSAKLDWANKERQSFVVNGIVDTVNVTAGMLLPKAATIATLEQTSFALTIKKMQAQIDQLEPQLFDAKLELDRAQELFDRTVLSEIELQKLDVIYKGLLAKKAAAQTDLRLAQYQQQKSILRTAEPVRVIDVKLQRGDVLNVYTQAEKYIALASVSSMLVSANISLPTALKIKNKTDFSVLIADKKYSAKMNTLSRVEASSQYRLLLKVELPESVNVLAGMDVEIAY